MNKKIFLLFIVAVMVVSLLGCQTENTTSPLSAALSELSGLVELKQAGQEGFAPASSDTTLEVNGQVQTGDDGRVRLDLSSGTIIRIAPSSFFTLTSNEETTDGLISKIKLELGKIFIILNGGQADVETPSGVASVRGSYMKVEVDPITKDIYVTCLEGNCSASNPSGKVDFTNGEKVVLYAYDEDTNTWKAPNVEPMNPEDFQEWLDNNPEAKELYEQAMGTATAMAQPTSTSTAVPSPTLEQALTPTQASSACFQIIQPAAGQALPKQGQVTFEWEEQQGAEVYVVTFVDPNGNTAVIETTGTTLNQYVEVLGGSQYSWFVTAYGENSTELCSTTTNTFSKPQPDPTAKPTLTKEEKEENEPVCDPCDEEGECPDPDACCVECQGGFIPERDIANIEKYAFFS